MKIVRQFIKWIKKWFWSKPTEKDKPFKATDVQQQYVCIKYHDQWINMRRSEIGAWNRMSRKDRRGMAHRFATLEKKGKITFVEINGKMICVKNKDYAARADDSQ